MLITVDRYLDPLEAYIVQGRLDAEGITSYVIHAQHIWVKWIISVALGMVKLQVPESEVKHARDVIARIRIGEYEKILIETGYSEIKLICPKCHGTNTERNDFRKKLALFFLMLFAIPVPYSLAYIRCNGCKYKWKDKDLITCSAFFIFTIIVITSTAISLFNYLLYELIGRFQ